MEFRPCIDIHNGKVKQIVGGSLRDEGDFAKENFVSEMDAAFFAEYYRKDGIRGGHIILLNSPDSAFYEATKAQAVKALRAYPGAFQIGGGINDRNAAYFLEQGASHVIVTSYVFSDGKVDYAKLQKLVGSVGKKRLTLDLSCRKRDGNYYIVTDRWQKFTDETVTRELLDKLSGYADEFLIHAVDVEGKSAGIEEELVKLLGDWDGLSVTYAGGVGSFSDLQKLKAYGRGRVNVTIGSALDLFGGDMPYREVLAFVREEA